MIKRVFLIVLDSVGIGALPDAYLYGDEGSNTIKSCCEVKGFSVPNLQKMGIFNIDGVDAAPGVSVPLAAYGRCAEASKGKDTTTGHWEICSLISEKPFPTYPDGFPPEIIKEFTEKTGRGVLCNKPYSGTKVIADFGKEHIKTGDLIVYTSADSVFQIAAHEDVVHVDLLYDYCEIARKILTGEHAVGRVIARPFKGVYPKFERTAKRHDFSLVPPGKTLLNVLFRNDIDVIAIGKIYDIFAGKSLRKSYPTTSNTHGMELTKTMLSVNFEGLCFTNLVDFDMLYGHRNDVVGYANALMEFDSWLGDFIKEMRSDDLLIITADHGCDPATESTDHSREYIPLLIFGEKVKSVNLGTRSSFADIGKTIADIFEVENDLQGVSFKNEILG